MKLPLKVTWFLPRGRRVVEAIPTTIAGLTLAELIERLGASA